MILIITTTTITIIISTTTMVVNEKNNDINTSIDNDQNNRSIGLLITTTTTTTTSIIIIVVVTMLSTRGHPTEHTHTSPRDKQGIWKGAAMVDRFQSNNRAKTASNDCYNYWWDWQRWRQRPSGDFTGDRVTLATSTWPWPKCSPTRNQ